MIHIIAKSYTSLGRAILRFPEAPWEDALSHGQLQSKAWAVNELAKLRRNLGLVYVVGGWLGLLPALMLTDDRLRFDRIRSFDIDSSCQPIADQINIENVIAKWRFKAVTADMFRMNYGTDHRYNIVSDGRTIPACDTCDTIINTACDHIAPFSRWWRLIPTGKLVLVQNNNFQNGGKDHNNTVKSLDDLMSQAPMKEILFKGTARMPKFTRFMIIGRK